MAEKGGISNLFEVFDRLSTREKTAVVGLGLAVAATFVFFFWFFSARQVTSLEERNDAVRSALEQIVQQKDAWKLKRAKSDAVTARLEGNKLRLVREMENQAKRLGFTIEDFKENKRYLTDNRRRKRKTEERQTVTELVEESQTVTIRRLSLKQLSEFLFNLERRPEPVKVTRLNIRTASSDRQVLREVRLTVATYRNEEVQL